MKIARYERDGVARLAFSNDGETFVDPLDAIDPSDGGAAWFTDTTAFIKAGGEARRRAEDLLARIPADARLERADMRLLAPLLPSTILCSGSNYRAHNAEKVGTPLSGQEPEFFIKTADCVIGPEEAIVHDPIGALCAVMTYEYLLNAERGATLAGVGLSRHTTSTPLLRRVRLIRIGLGLRHGRGRTIKSINQQP